MSAPTAPSRHGPATLIDDLCAGVLPEPIAILARAHAESCPRCQRRLRAAESAAGALLEATPGAAMTEGALDRCLDRLGPPDPPARPSDRDLPIELRALASEGIDALRWSWRGPARIARLLEERDGFDLRLLWIKPGGKTPEHRHTGLEATLVLRGAYRDGATRLGPGDLAFCDADAAHAPIAEEKEPCLCLIASAGAPVLTGRFGRLLGRALW